MQGTLETLIDAAARLCGSQNQLAARLGSTSANLAQAKLGARPLTDDQVQKLAEILGEEPAAVWLVAKDKRNPFKSDAKRRAALLALLAIGLGGTLVPTDALARDTARVVDYVNCRICIGWPEWRRYLWRAK